MGPNGSGKSTLVARADGPRRLRGDRRLGHDRRRGAARPAHVAARAARALPRDAVPGRGARRAARDARRRASMRARDVDAADLHDAVVAEATALGVRAELLARGVNDEFSGGEKKRAETVQLAVLRTEVRGPRRDRLRSRRRRAARRRPPRRAHDARGRTSACSRSRTTRACSPSCGPTACTCSSTAASCTSGGPELADELERTGYEGIAAELGIDELTVEAPADAIRSPTRLRWLVGVGGRWCGFGRAVVGFGVVVVRGLRLLVGRSSASSVRRGGRRWWRSSRADVPVAGLASACRPRTPTRPWCTSVGK